MCRLMLSGRARHSQDSLAVVAFVGRQGRSTAASRVSIDKVCRRGCIATPLFQTELHVNCVPGSCTVAAGLYQAPQWHSLCPHARMQLSGARCCSSPFTSRSNLRRSHSRRCSVRRAAAQSVPVPSTPEAQVSQAVQAIQAAWRAGITRQRVELLLPLIGATDLDDWPGGIRQQFKAAAPLVEAILRQLKQQEGLEGPLAAEIWDQGDAVGAWYGDKIGAVLFPTASTLGKVQQLAEPGSGRQLLLMFNPQWELKGNLVSDFGFGRRKEEALAFIDTYQSTYYLRQLRVTGDDLRVLRAYPGQWQIHVRTSSNQLKLLDTLDVQPEYKDLEAALKAWPESSSQKTWVERLGSEWSFVKNSLQNPPK